MKQRIGIDLTIFGKTASADIKPELLKTYRDGHHKNVSLPVCVELRDSEALDRDSKLSAGLALEVLDLLGLQPGDAEFAYAAEVQFRMRDDRVSVEYDVPGTGEQVSAVREDVQDRMRKDFGVELNLEVLTWDNPKLTRTFLINDGIRLDE